MTIWRWACAVALVPALATAGEPEVDTSFPPFAGPVVEAGAGAEMLLWDIRLEERIEDRDNGRVTSVALSERRRVQVFEASAVDSVATVELVHAGGERLQGIEGYVVRPDGSVVHLQPDQVFDKTLASAGSGAIRVRTFTMPGVTPGCIVDYRFTRLSPNDSLNGAPVMLQQRIPVRKIALHVKPVPGLAFGLRAVNIAPPKFAPEKHGWHGATLENIPAFHEEALMPPESRVQPWAYLYYGQAPGEPAWATTARNLHEVTLADAKELRELAPLAVATVAATDDADEKVRLLLDWIRRELRPADPWTGLDARTLKDVWRNRAADRGETTRIFCAAARHAGFDARLALVNDREVAAFMRDLPASVVLPRLVVAVKRSGAWVFVDPGSRATVHGSLRWQNEETDALVGDPGEALFTRTQASPPERSTVETRGSFTLSEAGDLEGDVRVVHAGHEATSLRASLEDLAADARLDRVRELLQERAPTGTWSDVTLEGLEKDAGPVTVKARLSLPGFAAFTGKRAFLRPVVFSHAPLAQKGASERRHPVVFPYRRREIDRVALAFPEGWRLEAPAAPARIEAPGVASHEVKLTTNAEGSRLESVRTFVIEDTPELPASGWQALCDLSGAIASADAQSLALTKASAGAGP